MNYQYGWNEDRFKAQSGRSRLAGRACGATNSRLATHRDDARLGKQRRRSGQAIERQPISLNRLLTELRFFSEADRRAIWLAR